MRRALLAALCLLLLAWPVRAQDFPSEHEAARAELPRLLAELGQWCSKRRLHDRTAEIAREILAIDRL